MNTTMERLYGAARAGLCLLGIFGFSAGAYSGESVAQPEHLELRLEENTVGASEIMAGDLTGAIATINTALVVDSRFEKNNNLCVVQILQHEFDSAETHCQTAISESRKVDAAELEAMARNNLGVLFALQGELNDAQKYFQSAVRVGKLSDALPLRNLSVLEKHSLSSDSTVIASF